MPANRLFNIAFLIISQLFNQLLAQNPLPDFTVKDIGKDRYVVSWINNYPYTAQITIQRSFDSTRGFKSILTVPDPTTKQNGYADTKAINDHMYYRLYILLDNGHYLFSAAKKPIKDLTTEEPSENKKPVVSLTTLETEVKKSNLENNPKKEPIQKEREEPISIQTQTTLVTPPTRIETSIKQDSASTSSNPLPEVKRIEPVVHKIIPDRAGDSAKTPTAVTTKEEPNAFAPSLYVFSHPDGNIRIQVPNRARLARYRIKFYESDQRFLFELKNLPAPSFQLDKINFLHAGWFLFELYEDSRLIEKHKVYLDKP
ncbi:MAG: hypothetical protein RLZ05_1499 [Bacteroidota bacterium]|jgi:hypothetical protein